MPSPNHSDESLAAIRALRREHEGVLSFGDRRSPVRFVHDVLGRSIIIPVEQRVLEFESIVVFCPDEPSCQVQIMASPREIVRPEASALVDKWSAYHGRVSARKWAACIVEGVRTSFDIVDPDDLGTAGLSAGAEARLVKRINTDAARLIRACRRAAAADVSDPLCVGVDDLGINVRARFGIVRLEFDALVASEDAAARAIDALLAAESTP